ncbi:MAG: asparagine--tRNA ligase, partial [Spirochaetales bacterium]|nr:asparagine--tRNA ligase [Spirochaetales bacterium]
MEESIAKLLLRQAGPETVTVKGWLRTKRVGKTMSFLEVNDGSCLKGIQVVVNNETFADLQVLDSLTTGCSLICRGKIVDSVGGNQAVELAAESIELVGACPADTYPLQKKRHTLEYLREIGHLRARTNTIGAAARVRNTMAYAVHSFFQEHGFCYVNTPLITASDAEGAGAMFQVTTLDIGNPPRTEDGAVDYSKDFFGRPTLLTVSGQLEGETYAMALKNIYTFGPTFRAENSLTKRHLAEFWMVEPEMAFYDVNDL